MLRVLVVDDSPTARALIVEVLLDDDEFEVVGEAGSGDEAVRMTQRLRPDVITMDIHMPGMDGFEATKQIMIAHPTPIVIVSSSTTIDEVATGMRALRAGALTLLRKPPGPGSPNYDQASFELVNTVKLMADVKVVRHFRSPSPEIVQATNGMSGTNNAACMTNGAPRTIPGAPQAANRGGEKVDQSASEPLTRGVVAVAASTGGPPAIQQVLTALPLDFPWPVLIVQHIAKGFAEGFSQWLNTTVALPVETARQGVPLAAGHVYVAPEGGHLGVGAERCIEISHEAPLGGFRPSATYLFNSVAGVYRDTALAVIMTGMGSDGVDGLRGVKQCGGTVIAQDEATSVVFGMPGAAVDAGVVDETVELDRIAARIHYLVLRRACR